MNFVLTDKEIILMGKNFVIIGIGQLELASPALQKACLSS